ncbi:MAG: hypothetical protein R2873_08470 [Caldilineaceae bacterium]|nr:hypothetical protein [Caldilineaceae bacterium]
MSSNVGSIVDSIVDTVRPMLESAWETMRNPSVTNVPPSAEDQRRTDLATIGVIVVAILLGWMIGNGAMNAVDEYDLADGLLSVVVPERWITNVDGEDGVIFSAVDPASASTFDSRVEVIARPLKEGEDLTMLNVSWPLRRGQELERFRTLSSEVVTGPTGEDALLITYAYVADPTRESGALGLPVVVSGQDLVFLAGEADAQQVVVVSTAADAAEMESAEETFAALFDHLGVRAE